ncbi:MAG: type II toxin-antitoxin system RelB family antitoxin [Microbacteriaceae bacterium]|jgi:RHH-type rel operon transcriptional repressor/antitoxin RelB
MTLTVRLDEAQELALEKLAADTGRTKSYYVKQALDQFLEDRADYLTALAVLERNERTYSAAEVRRELGL